jgi:uncharacterized protein (DUF1810 family)
MSDPFDLSRFVQAQAPVMARVTAELSAGRKRTHWMWFVFPQLAGLGFSAMAAKYALRSLDQARAYLAHPVLGPRLVDCTTLVLAASDRDAHAIFGSPDDLKFRSSMTLFARAAPQETVFGDALAKYFGGEGDSKTLSLLDAVDEVKN